MNGKTVRVFLADGTSNGILTAEIMNWTGRITVTPRSMLAEFAKRNEASRTGVYILAGEDTDNPDKNVVYIGESDDVLTRLKQHIKDPKKDFWNQTIIITSKDENLTKSHVRYLESRLIQITYQTKSVTISNGTSPDTTQLPEPDTADMEYFLEQIQLLLPVLGFQFASPLPTISQTSTIPSSQSNTDSTNPIFTMKINDVNAKAQEIGDKFIILKGSFAREKVRKSLKSVYKQKRKELMDKGILVATNDDNTKLTFLDDVPLASPSTAACIIGGTSLNGREYWKEQVSQKTYKEWQEAQV